MINPRRISSDELEVLALRWARSQPGRILNNINVDCFIAGFKAAHDILYHRFSDFLMAEGQFYEQEYTPRRIEVLRNSNIPLNTEHAVEFSKAEEFGRKLYELGEIYKDVKLLP